LRNIISGTDEEGRTPEPKDDMITTLLDVINMAELESAQRAKDTEEVSADGSDNDNNASQCSAGSRRDEPYPGYRVEPRLAGNATSDDVAQAAAETAADVRAWNRQRGRVDDETLIFPSATLEQAGAGSRVGPASYSVIDSIHDFDLASLCHKSEVTMLTSGALAKLPEHNLRKASGSETSLHSEKGWEAPERPQQLQNRNQINKSRSSSTSRQCQSSSQLLFLWRANISSGLTHLQATLTLSHGLQSPCARALKRRGPPPWNTSSYHVQEISKRYTMDPKTQRGVFLRSPLSRNGQEWSRRAHPCRTWKRRRREQHPGASGG
jgi:hypothetical protein